MNPADIGHLPVADKLRLMETLWDALCREAERASVPAWHEAVLAERLARLESGREPVSSWSEAKVRIRERAKAG